MEKVYNSAYYNYVPDEFIGPFETTLQRFKDKFGEQLILRDSLQDVSDEDRLIYQVLRDDGEAEKTWYFDYNIRKGTKRAEDILSIKTCLEQL